jgi:hypothetical protein
MCMQSCCQHWVTASTNGLLGNAGGADGRSTPAYLTLACTRGARSLFWMSAGYDENGCMGGGIRQCPDAMANAVWATASGKQPVRQGSGAGMLIEDPLDSAVLLHGVAFRMFM